jgi:hypothetical protein
MIIVDNKSIVTVIAYPNMGPINVLATPNFNLVRAIGEQGPRGMTGPVGPSGGSVLTYISPRDLGGGRVVTGFIDYADSSDTLTASKAIGFTLGAVSIGENVSILLSGELDGFFGLISGEIIYLSTNGLITQTPPPSGYIQKLGVALNPTTILINIQEPIVL